MYFSWQTVQWDYEAALNQLKFAGISFGFFGRPGGGSKGCCGFGAGASPVKMFLDYSFYVSYLREKSAATSPGTAFGFGGELGPGIMFSRIGLYLLVNYQLDAMLFTRKIVFSDSTTSDINILHLWHGFEIRVGYNFDLQALFN